MKKWQSACCRKGLRGFTLIEMMIVVAVVAILSAIAYPSYTEFVMRGKRLDGKAGLQRAAQWLEKAATVTGSYPDAANTLVNAGLDWSEDRRYKISATLTSSSFELTATPAGFVDGKCATFGLTHAGIKKSTGTEDLSYCWAK